LAIDDLLTSWEDYVIEQGQWQEHQYDGYRTEAVDLTAYWRPTLRGLKTKHYYPFASKALLAVVLGIIARVGSVNGQRVAIITDLVRADPDDPAESSLQARVVQQTAKTLGEDTAPQDVLQALIAHGVTLEKFEIAVPTLDEIFMGLRGNAG
jgi:hypothetical protein